VHKEAIKTAIERSLGKNGSPEARASVIEFVTVEFESNEIPSNYAFKALLGLYKADNIKDDKLQNMLAKKIPGIVQATLRHCYNARGNFTSRIDNIILSEFLRKWKTDAIAMSQESTSSEEDASTENNVVPVSEEQTNFLSEEQTNFLTEVFTEEFQNLKNSIAAFTSTSKNANEIKALRSDINALRIENLGLRAAVKALYQIHGKEMPSFAKSHGTFATSSRKAGENAKDVILKPENSEQNSKANNPGPSQ